MKDILIVVSPSTGMHLEVCKTMKTEAQKLDKSVRQLLGSLFLTNGPKSLKIALLLHRIASENNIPVAIFEIEAVLYAPSQASSMNPN
jgi:hypothetical protein